MIEAIRRRYYLVVIYFSRYLDQILYLSGNGHSLRLFSPTFHELMLARDGDTMERSKWDIFPVWVSILVPDPSFISTELYLYSAVSIIILH